MSRIRAAPENPRPFMATGLLFLGIALLWALTGAFGEPLPLTDAPAWFLLAGWLGASWLATVVWYYQPFVKRALPPVLLVRFPLALLAAALLALAYTAFATRAALAFEAFRIGLAIAFASALLLLVLPALVGRAWRGGVPSWRKDTPYRFGDGLAAGAAGAALVHAALGAAVPLTFPVRGPGAPALVLLAVGFAAQAYAALALHFLPRNVKRPLGAAGRALAAGALVAGNGGVLLLVAGFLWPVNGPPLAWGGVLGVIGVLVLGAFLAVTPWRGPRENPGRLLVPARAWLTASGVLYLLAGVATLVVLARLALLAALLPALLTLLVVAAGLAQGGFAVLAWPVALNAVPRGAAWSRVGAAAAVVGAVLVAAAIAAPWAGKTGAVLLAGAVLAHGVQIAPLRTPRRDCPPA